MKNLIIFLLYESDDSQESFSFIAELSREKRTTPSEYLQEVGADFCENYF